jgi:hypothetical protein
MEEGECSMKGRMATSDCSSEEPGSPMAHSSPRRDFAFDLFERLRQHRAQNEVKSETNNGLNGMIKISNQ